ncbi:hypothetical protein TSOC_012283 [Tetrabaena socialis]|uniref:VWFA domain-containing protein n=1 Tax=Tetrabaena socialis TaxID=47790 RepID=A0A2J7ZNG4_9CHLO|nr:hypothetical protein TSOC_012283 [Tetrabaena socialis]|eukprot:PNH01806.1 hypothetical protein TSOC_012283 [Tetrabaena socialis]
MRMTRAGFQRIHPLSLLAVRTYDQPRTTVSRVSPPIPPPDEVQELELRVDVDKLDALLAFLSCSFMGGTDVDAPLKLSLERLAKAEWCQADILMVTDGEIPMPEDAIVQAITRANAEMGLEVHGLLVSNHVTEPMKRLCTDVHIFKSWSAVPGGNDYMH